MGTIALDDLSVFVTIVEAASFSGAAARLGVPKSSVSRAIARLEDAIGVRILHRTTRQVALSTAGNALYERVRTQVNSLRHAVDELPELEEELSGRLRVTTVTDMADLMADLVTQFIARYPAVEVEVRLTNDQVDLVAEGIDLALRFSTKPLKDSSLSARKIGPSTLELFAAPSYLARRGTPRTPRELDGHEWVVHRHATQLRLEGQGTAVVVPRGRVLCDNFFFLRAALVDGCGIGALPGEFGEPAVALGKLVRVLPRWSCKISDFWAIWPGTRKPPRKVSAFLDLGVEALKAWAGRPPS